MNLILASSSPRRKELIKELKGYDIEVIPPKVDESLEPQNVANMVYAMNLAEAKALSVYNICHKLVLGADTIVCLDNKKLGKPRNVEDAYNMFRILCGKTHEVITGISLMSEKKAIKAYQRTFVSFYDYNQEVIDKYISLGLYKGKAGGYGIQDKELKPLIKNVEGDVFNVIGLPVSLIKKILEENF